MPQMPLHTCNSKPIQNQAIGLLLVVAMDAYFMGTHTHVYHLEQWDCLTVATLPFLIYHLAQVVHSQFGHDLVHETF